MAPHVFIFTNKSVNELFRCNVTSNEHKKWTLSCYYRLFKQVIIDKKWNILDEIIVVDSDKNEISWKDIVQLKIKLL
jgi:hypothetical protein